MYIQSRRNELPLAGKGQLNIEANVQELDACVNIQTRKKYNKKRKKIISLLCSWKKKSVNEQKLPWPQNVTEITKCGIRKLKSAAFEPRLVLFSSFRQQSEAKRERSGRRRPLSKHRNCGGFCSGKHFACRKRFLVLCAYCRLTPPHVITSQYKTVVTYLIL